MTHLAAGYAALIAVWLGLRRVTHDRRWWIQFINEFTPFLLAPSAPLLLLAVLRRRSTDLLAAAVPLTAFLTIYGPRLAAKPGIERSPGPRLRVMTLNMLCRPRSSDATIAAIRESGADVVMVQELIPVMAEPLGPALYDLYPYQAIYPGYSARGAAVFSRLPIRCERKFQLTPRGWYCQALSVEWDGRPVALFNVHLLRPECKPSPEPERDWHIFDSRDRALETERLLDQAVRDDQDVIVAGDFNMTDQAADYRAMTEYFKDAFIDAGRGFGFTYPAKSPHGRYWYERNAPAFLRLDHVFYRGALRAESAKVGPNGDSDHFSLIVDFARN